jgi:hypothetical protein
MYIFPKSIAEIRKSITKFFIRYRNEPKDSVTRLALSSHDYAALDIRFQVWLSLDDRLNELNNLARETKEERDKVWDTELLAPLQVARKIVIICNPDSAVTINNFGFESKNNTTKEVPTERKVKNQAERLSINVNALKEAQALAQKPSAAISVTVNEVTKSTSLVEA